MTVKIKKIMLSIQDMKYKFLLYIPILFFIYWIIDILTINNRLYDLAAHPEVVNNFILAQFTSILVVIVLNYFHVINKIIKKNLDLYIVALILFLLKLNMLNVSNIDLNIIYLFQIALSIFIELFIVLVIKYFLFKHISKLSILVYFLILNIILLLNIGIYVYYYTTFELIEPIIYSNINIESIKGYLTNYTNSEILLIAVLPILFNILIYILLNKGFVSIDRIGRKGIKNIFILFISLFASYHILFIADKYTIRKVLVLYDYIRIKQDTQVNKICQNSLYTYLTSFYDFKYPKESNQQTKKISFTKEDLAILARLNLEHSAQDSLYKKKYDKIIFIIFESLSIDFLHHYNKKISSDVTPYFDKLLGEYFHLNNFYTSNMPTDYGMTAILKSKLDLNTNSNSIFHYFKKQNYSTYLINAVSQYYGIMGNYYPQSFDPYEWIYKEKLEKEYGNKSSGWGFHNDTLYDKSLNIINNNKNNKLLMVVKTIDFHQPGTYVPHAILKKYPNENHIIHTLRWIDNELKKFIEKIPLDDKTLIIITADHNPHKGVDFQKYALKGNYKKLSKIPLIFITKNHDFSKFNHLEDSLYSQVDLLPTLLSINNINFNNKEYFGNNVFTKKPTPILGKYKNSLYYKFKNKSFECSLESLENNETCKAIKKYYLYTQYLQ